MNNEGAPTSPDRPTEAELKASRVHIEIDYFMPKEQMAIRHKIPTILLEGILLDAVAEVAKIKQKPTPPDGKITVVIDYDLIADRMLIESNAPRAITKGVLAHALGGVTRNQFQQDFQVYKYEMDKRVAALEADLAKRKIILAGG